MPSTSALLISVIGSNPSGCGCHSGRKPFLIIISECELRCGRGGGRGAPVPALVQVHPRWANASAVSASLGVKRRAIGTPDRRAKGTPHRRWDRLVPVANRRDPRASRSALTSDGAARVGGACLPTG